MNGEDEHVTLEPAKARQGSRGKQMVAVLAISLALAGAGLAALWGGWSSEVGSAGVAPSHERSAIERDAQG